MEKTVIYCDICAKPEARQFSFAVDRELDGAGGTDEVHKRVDLCTACCASQLELFILSLPWPARAKLAEDILKRKLLYLTHMTRTQRNHGGVSLPETPQ